MLPLNLNLKNDIVMSENKKIDNARSHYEEAISKLNGFYQQIYQHYVDEETHNRIKTKIYELRENGYPDIDLTPEDAIFLSTLKKMDGDLSLDNMKKAFRRKSYDYIFEKLNKYQKIGVISEVSFRIIIGF